MATTSSPASTTPPLPGRRRVGAMLRCSAPFATESGAVAPLPLRPSPSFPSSARFPSAPSPARLPSIDEPPHLPLPPPTCFDEPCLPTPTRSASLPLSVSHASLCFLLQRAALTSSMPDGRMRAARPLLDSFVSKLRLGVEARAGELCPGCGQRGPSLPPAPVSCTWATWGATNFPFQDIHIQT
jgi:hypothetical protein